MLYDTLAIAESPCRQERSEGRDLLMSEHGAGRAFTRPSDALERWLARARFAASQDTSLRAPNQERRRPRPFAHCRRKTTLREVAEGDLLGTLRHE